MLVSYNDPIEMGAFHNEKIRIVLEVANVAIPRDLLNDCIKYDRLLIIEIAQIGVLCVRKNMIQKILADKCANDLDVCGVH